MVSNYKLQNTQLIVCLRISLILVSVITMPACATPNFIKLQADNNFSRSTKHENQFKLLSIYMVNNFEQHPWLYELSGVAWDYDQELLYSVTDTGYLLVLKPLFDGNRVSKIDLLFYYPLLDKKGKPLQGASTDSEGIALVNHKNQILNDTELLISFERLPRVVRYTPQGRLIKETTIAAPLNNSNEYQSANKQLESITELPQGQILTGPERPLKSSTTGIIDLFNSFEKTVHLKLRNPEYGSLVGMTTLPDSNVLALERVFIDVFSGLMFHIHLLNFNGSKHVQSTVYSSRLEDKLLYDNFEGITHHRDNYFFMVSDDNQNAHQRGLICYFQLPGL